uniref:Uncharacterized protein n=1 Tax=Anguilla anguilla TaxID=7936 RepID=A0A0E9VTS7_ANGAN
MHSDCIFVYWGINTTIHS